MCDILSHIAKYGSKEGILLSNKDKLLFGQLNNYGKFFYYLLQKKQINQIKLILNFFGDNITKEFALSFDRPNDPTGHHMYQINKDDQKHGKYVSCSDYGYLITSEYYNDLLHGVY